MRIAIAALMCLLCFGPSRAENVDPDNDGSHFAWSENLGWLNARPGGPGGPGIQVADAGLTGWIWSENAGWISLSCANSASCGTSSYGVANNGCGTLSGYAWSENAGWINFAPATCGADPTCGVKIDPASGTFAGRAWSENTGWITFSATSPVAYKIVTSWRPVAMTGTPNVFAAKPAGSASLAWTPLPGATSYDVVRGSVSALRSSGGDYQTATQACAADNTSATSLAMGADPAVGEGIWFLVRGVGCAGAGTYDSGAASQSGLRDAEIAASGSACP